MDIKKQLGLKIKRLRRKQGLTQEQFAEKIEIAPRTLCGIENGENFLTAETLEKILDELGVTCSELFAFDHIKPQDELIKEIVNDVQKLTDRSKIEIIYKIVKATLIE